MRSRLALPASIIIALVGLSSCQQRQSASVTGAVDALRKLETATEVGITYEQYSTLLIDAKMKVEAAYAAIDDEALRGDINSALYNYLDAGEVWRLSLRNEAITLREEPGRTILPKYSIQVDDQGRAADYNAAMQAIWKSASFRMANIRQGM